MIYIDTNIFIYLLEGNIKFANKVAKYLEEAKNEELMTSAITVTELVAGNKKIKPHMLKMLSNLEIVALDTEIAATAGSLKNKENILIGDAIHLATAINFNCIKFYTNDEKLAKKAAKYMKVEKP